MEASTAILDPSSTFAALADAMRGELKRHCYRMVGGVQDAEDCVQEALLRGWREFSSLRDERMGRAWLYSIATRVCLDALRTRRRRQTLFGPSLDEVEPGTGPWVEPWPDGVLPAGPESAQDIRLAFISLLRGLSPRARAVLLLHDVVGMTAAEAGVALGISMAAARSALQRARAALPAREIAEATDAPVEAYVDAWNAGDVGGNARWVDNVFQRQRRRQGSGWRHQLHASHGKIRFEIRKCKRCKKRRPGRPVTRSDSLERQLVIGLIDLQETIHER